MEKITSAIIGPGNIGTDLLVKLLRSPLIDVQLMAGIYPESPGLARAEQLGVASSADGLDAIHAVATPGSSAATSAVNTPELRSLIAAAKARYFSGSWPRTACCRSAMLS